MITLSSCRDLFESAMGLCLSCCPRSSDTDSVGPDGDRSRLITDVHADNSNAWNTRDSDEEPVDLPNGSYSESYPTSLTFILLTLCFVMTSQIKTSALEKTFYVA